MIGIHQLKDRIEADCDPQLLDKLQLIYNCDGDIDKQKQTILILHKLPDDAIAEKLKDGAWTKYSMIVFVSHWLQEQYYQYLQVPYYAGTVVYAGIELFESNDKPDPKDEINLIYHTDPNRGLDYLYAAVKELSNEFPNIRLNVFPSGDIDKENEDLVDLMSLIKNNKNMTLWEKSSQDKIRNMLKDTHIFAYPSVWQETACLPLMEALSAGCYCVHSSLGALKETSLGITQMYPFTDNTQNHVDRFYLELKKAIMLHKLNYEYVKSNTETTKTIADYKYDWEVRKEQWNKLFEFVLAG